jgi:cytochrome c oxidase cbb3-type subunit III
MKYAALMMVTGFVLSSCDAPGRGAAEAQAIRPSEVANFGELFSRNCSGCHGVNGQGALTVGIGRPMYLAIADDAIIRRTIEEGRPGTPMQAFAQRAGGMLTEAQIDILIRGIRNWATPGAFDHENPPPYASSKTGDAARGREVFATECSSCHGPDGGGARAILDSSYLALVTDQHLRTVMIVGMPNLGMPDWRGYLKPLTDADLTDLVAWLASQREPLSAHLNP